VRPPSLSQARALVATLAVAVSIVGVGATAPAAAAPTTVSVRIEGRAETLFEGPILTDVRTVRASSDTKAPKGGRRCNGLNNGGSPVPGPTPTAASVDAMSILGLDFDGQWYAEPFEDYFVDRWGPDAEDEGAGEFWGVVVNNVFTGVGGCQYVLDEGDEVLWVYDAFRGRSRLALYPADHAGGAAPLTASVELGQPFEVAVEAWDAVGEGTPPPSPQRAGAEPFAGARVAPVVSGPGGFELVDGDDPATVVTDTNGLAAVELGETGWHRIKATAVGSGGNETAVRSNRLDVCVFESAPSECPPPPADDLARVPPPPPDEGEGEPEQPSPPADGGGSGAGLSPPAVVPLPPVAPGQVVLRLAPPDRSRLDEGLVRVGWRVLDPGPGIARWAVSSLTLGRKGARYVRRASGRSASAATLRLPAGASYRLRLNVEDTLGRRSAATIGTVRVPR
jgi:hypothetical protein